MESRFFEVEEGKLHIRIPKIIKSEFPLVLFLHGASPKSQHTDFWNPLIDRILTLCNPVLLDRFGHGKSQINTGVKIGINEQITSIIRLIDHLLETHELENIILVGRSQGGAYATRIAKIEPDKIQALGLIAPGSMKTNYTNLIDWKKPISILWDIEDPIVKFENYQFIKKVVQDHKLFVIGETKENTEKSINRGKIPKSHVPELMAHELFTTFLASLVE